MLHRIEANGPEFDGMQDYGAHLVVNALLDAMVNMDQRRKAIFVAFHDVIPGTTYVKPGSRGRRNCGAPSTARWKKSGPLSKSGA